MKSYLLSSALLVMLASAANAADIADAPTSDWTGIYAGVFGGYAWGSADLSSTTNAEDFKIPSEDIPSSFGAEGDLEGWLGGAQVGYDYDFGSGFVLGAVADWAITGLETDSACLEDFGREDCNDSDPFHTEGNASMDWLATFRARAGFATGDALIYATGGLAVANVEVNIDNLGFDGDNYSDSDTLTGWTAGAGVEYRLTENVSVGAEYLYVDLGTVETNYELQTLGPVVDIHSETDFTMNIVKASLNYRF
jgi:outer membrane immunogenic protein